MSEQTPAQRMAWIECIMSSNAGVLGSDDARFLIERCRTLEKVAEAAFITTTYCSCPSEDNCSCAFNDEQRLLRALREAGYVGD